MAGLGLTHCLTVSPHSQGSQTARRPPAEGCTSYRPSQTSPWTGGGGGDVGRRVMLAGLTMLEDRPGGLLVLPGPPPVTTGTLAAAAAAPPLSSLSEISAHLPTATKI